MSGQIKVSYLLLYTNFYKCNNFFIEKSKRFDTRVYPMGQWLCQSRYKNRRTLKRLIQWESGFARAGTRIGKLLKDLSNGKVASPLFAEIYLRELNNFVFSSFFCIIQGVFCIADYCVRIFVSVFYTWIC